MAIAIGIALAGCVICLASFSHLDRDRAFYPTVMIVIASYYALFAVMGGAADVLAMEAIPIAVFVAVSLWGFRHSLWLVVAALVGHGVFDSLHGRLIPNPGVPAWWPHFCLAFDVVAGLYLAWLLKSHRRPARADLNS